MAKRVVRKLPVAKIDTASEIPQKINLPKVSLNFNRLKSIKTSQILVLLLIVAAFLIGVLLTKVQYLEKGQATVPNPNTAPVGNQGTPTTPVPGAKVNVAIGNLPAKGDKNAKVTIIEFADFRCPFCEQFFTSTESQIIKDYVDTGKAQFVFRNFAFLGPASITAADAAECANDQGKFWEYHDYLYKNQPSETDTSMYNTDTLTQAAVSLGMNDSQFRSCLDNKTDEDKVNKDMTDGQAAGVSGTPTFVINGNVLVGALPYSNFKAAIDQELAK